MGERERLRQPPRWIRAERRRQPWADLFCELGVSDRPLAWR